MVADAGLTFTLPFPPSMNHYWRRVGNKTLISRSGREFRETVCTLLDGTTPLAGPLAVVIVAHPPDRRRRDLDNLNKAVLDALQHGGAYHDDSQIDDLRIVRGSIQESGCVVVTIYEAARASV